MEKNNAIIKYLLKDKRISKEFKKILLGGTEEND